MSLSIKTEPSKNQPLRLDHINKTNLLAYFQQTWALYDGLFSAIKDDVVFYESPDPLRNPLVFYVGHTAAFYLNKMHLAGLIKQGINSRYEKLFAKGVDPNLPEQLDVLEQWPSMDEVRAYRIACRKIIEDCICQYPYEKTTWIHAKHPLWSILMGIEHERIHFETSSMLLRQVEVTKLTAPLDWTYAPTKGAAPKNNIIPVKGGVASIGKLSERNLYGWDNEYGFKAKIVQAFEASQNLISNQEYLEFYNSGAYKEPKYWTAEGWEWKERTNTKHPKFWIERPNGFEYRAMFKILPMPLDYPVEVNAHEAWAYCKWKGADWRLLSEAEFHIIAHNEIKESDCAFNEGYNLNMKYGSPNPVGSLSTVGTSLGFNDLFGNVWDWLSDDFYPLPGFETHPWYDDFSKPYFDDQHSMLLGGSWASTGTSASKYYRLWFRKHFYQHAGFRIARSVSK